MEEVSGSDDGDRDTDVEVRKERTVFREVRRLEGTGFRHCRSYRDSDAGDRDTDMKVREERAALK